MVAYTKLQQWKKEESERIRGQGDQIESMDLTFKSGQMLTSI